ncbi:THY1 Predicted alternative thymidylate synthase [uncultured Caudovirales phage]|uniref:THY1 Predicted alternative thymidylate synthase n=1 Tax=uncultured Caudovirales phage TaxID=2100421 RepID=A0A6J5NSL4_9CAUD|nr:THY1 Predicted alternative thymidylate synthase [uncultured Caudovirales phage]
MHITPSDKVKKIYNEVGDDIGFVHYVSHLNDDMTIVNAARASFEKYKEDEMTEQDVKLLKRLMSDKHTSTFEHNVIVFRVKVPIFVSKQHMRHRTWSYSETSRRYTEENIEFYLPKNFRVQHKNNRQASVEIENFNPVIHSIHGEESVYEQRASELLTKHSYDCLKLYNNMLDAGVCREQARMVLPNNLYTTYWASTDLNNLLKFLDLREEESAQWEIRMVAKAMREFAEEIWPVAMENYNLTKQKRNEFEQWKQQQQQK